MFKVETIERKILIAGKEHTLTATELDDLDEIEARDIVREMVKFQREGAEKIKKLTTHKSKKPVVIQKEARLINEKILSFISECLIVCKIKIDGKLISKKDMPIFVKKYSLESSQALCVKVIYLGRIKDVEAEK